jgi:single-stranded DNA-binding protein
MSLATTDSRKNKQTGKWENGDTHWHSISLFGDAVRTARELKKGDCVNVKGKVTYSKKDDKYYTNIVCFKCERITSDQNNQTNVAPNKPANDGGDIPF